MCQPFGFLLQVRDGMSCGCYEMPDSASLCPFAFTSKSLSSTEQHYSNIEQEALRILHGLQKLHHFYFVKEVCIITDNKTIRWGNQQDCGHVIPALALHHAVHSSVHNTHYIQTWSRSVHGRPVIPEQPYRKQGPGNYGHKQKHVCHQHISKYSSMHINRRHVGSNHGVCRPPKAKIEYNTRLATQKRSET